MIRDIRMVKVSGKNEIKRRAKAVGKIILSKGTIEKIKRGEIEKGDVITATKLVAIYGAKKTSELLPLCHPLRITHVNVDVRILEDSLEVEVEVEVVDRTGPDMEALTACALALLNVFDMVKGYEKDKRGLYPVMKIERIELIEKFKEEM